MHMTNINIHELNAWAKEHIIDDNMFDDDGFLITENKSDFRTTGIIAEILEQSWDSFYSKYKEIDDDHIIIKYDGKLYFATKIHAGGAYTAREYLVIGGEFQE